ncbi:hypothetical protein AB0C84_35865 [Actinomadura sp. NPDC048955]
MVAGRRVVGQSGASWPTGVCEVGQALMGAAQHIGDPLADLDR